MAKLSRRCGRANHVVRMSRTKLRSEGSDKQPNIINMGYENESSSHVSGRGYFFVAKELPVAGLRKVSLRRSEER